MSISGSLVLLKLHVQDRTGNRRAISGFVREGITLLEGIMDVVKQHGGNCVVEFNQQMMLGYLKKLEIGGIQLEDWIQFYSVRCAGSESETMGMCFRLLRNNDVFWENLNSKILSGASEFDFFIRDDVGMTKDLSNPMNVLDAASARLLNMASFDGVRPSVYPATHDHSAIFVTPNDARNLQLDTSMRIQRPYVVNPTQNKGGGGGSSHGDSMDAKTIQEKESDKFYVIGTLNPSTETASLDKSSLLSKSGIDFSSKDGFELQRLVLQVLPTQSSYLSATPALSSPGGSTLQSQSSTLVSPVASASSFHSDFLPFVSASSETVNTVRTQFLSENPQMPSQPQSSAQNSTSTTVRDFSYSTSPKSQYLLSYLPVSEIRQSTSTTSAPNATQPPAMHAHPDIIPVPQSLLSQFLVRAMVSAISQRALSGLGVPVALPQISPTSLVPNWSPRVSVSSLPAPPSVPSSKPFRNIVAAEQNQAMFRMPALSPLPSALDMLLPTLSLPKSVLSASAAAVPLPLTTQLRSEPISQQSELKNPAPEPMKKEYPKPEQIHPVNPIPVNSGLFIPHARIVQHAKIPADAGIKIRTVLQIPTSVRVSRQGLPPGIRTVRVAEQKDKPKKQTFRKTKEPNLFGRKPRIAEKETNPRKQQISRELKAQVKKPKEKRTEEKQPRVRKHFRKFEPLNDAPSNAKQRTKLQNPKAQRLGKQKLENKKSNKKPDSANFTLQKPKTRKPEIKKQHQAKSEKRMPVNGEKQSHTVSIRKPEKRTEKRKPDSGKPKLKSESLHQYVSRFRSVKEIRKSDELRIGGPVGKPQAISSKHAEKQRPVQPTPLVQLSPFALAFVQIQRRNRRSHKTARNRSVPRQNYPQNSFITQYRSSSVPSRDLKVLPRSRARIFSVWERSRPPFHFRKEAR